MVFHRSRSRVDERNVVPSFYRVFHSMASGRLDEATRNRSFVIQCEYFFVEKSKTGRIWVHWLTVPFSSTWAVFLYLQKKLGGDRFRPIVPFKGQHVLILITLPCSSKIYWVLLGFTWFYWVLLGPAEFYLVLLGFNVFLLGLTGFC